MSGDEGTVQSVNYPIEVIYCGVCTMPLEYCEYYPMYERCKEWLHDNLPDQFEKLGLGSASGDAEEGDDEKKKRQTRGGRGVIKAKKKAVKERRVCLSRASRGKKKSVTCIVGLATCDVDLKKAAKFFGTKLATGASVTGDDEIVIQGDLKDEVYDLILENFEIDEDSIEDLGDRPR